MKTLKTEVKDMTLQNFVFIIRVEHPSVNFIRNTVFGKMLRSLTRIRSIFRVSECQILMSNLINYRNATSDSNYFVALSGYRGFPDFYKIRCLPMN